MSIHAQLVIAAILICTGIILIPVTLITKKWQYSAAGAILALVGTILALISGH